MLRLICLIAALALTACVSQYEAELSNNKEWEQLGTYHGEHGYREWDEKQLNKQGAMTETDYEQYRAGYLKGRFDYCSGRQRVGTVINPGYPDECDTYQSSYGLTERGY